MNQNSTMAKPAVAACQSDNNSWKQAYTAEEEALSESEINAVMQLVQLSGADSHYSDHHHQEDDNSFSFFSFNKASVNVIASSSYSSLPPPPPPVAAAAVLAEEDHHDGGGVGGRRNLGERRKNKRYRSIAELYRVTVDEIVEEEDENDDGRFKFLEETD